MNTSRDWGCERVTVTLEPEGKTVGRAKMSMQVYRRYGDPEKAVIQAVCNRIGGSTVYFSAVGPDGVVLATIPAAGWRNPENRIDRVAEFCRVVTDKDNGSRIICFGADRKPWRMSVTGGNMVTDELDTSSDRAAAALVTVYPNGIRRTF